jgi:tetratricopeptide (TPR) repeat protein
MFLIMPLTGAYAETKEIIAEGTYIMSDGETPSVAKERAILDAKRLAVEQAGTFLESYSVVRDLQLVKDELRIVAAEVLDTTVVDNREEILDGEIVRFWVRVRCVVNTDNLKAASARLQDRSELDKLRKLQEDYDQVVLDNLELKVRLAQANTFEVRKQVKAALARNEQAFTAVQWLQKGYEYLDKQKDNDMAIAAFSQAIALNPQYAEAYNNRGVAYVYKGRYDLASADYERAISIKPQYAQAYYNRGVIEGRKGQYNMAINDYDRAIALNPRYARAYYNRALAHYRTGHNDKAIADLSHVIALSPQDAHPSVTAAPYIRRKASMTWLSLIMTRP